jgi:hypothetical protein
VYVSPGVAGRERHGRAVAVDRDVLQRRQHRVWAVVVPLAAVAEDHPRPAFKRPDAFAAAARNQFERGAARIEIRIGPAGHSILRGDVALLGAAVGVVSPHAADPDVAGNVRDRLRRFGEAIRRKFEDGEVPDEVI